MLQKHFYNDDARLMNEQMRSRLYIYVRPLPSISMSVCPRDSNAYLPQLTKSDPSFDRVLSVVDVIVAGDHFSSSFSLSMLAAAAVVLASGLYHPLLTSSSFAIDLVVPFVRMARQMRRLRLVGNASFSSSWDLLSLAFCVLLLLLPFSFLSFFSFLFFFLVAPSLCWNFFKISD